MITPEPMQLGIRPLTFAQLRRIYGAPTQVSIADEAFAAVREAHESGWPGRKIAEAVGISHQRVHQILHGR